MSKRTLTVGAIVRLPRVATTTRNGTATFRIEQLLQLEDGLTLYKVKSETEPFDRIVAECDLAVRPQ
jgi:hypothetical protein